MFIPCFMNYKLQPLDNSHLILYYVKSCVNIQIVSTVIWLITDDIFVSLCVHTHTHTHTHTHIYIYSTMAFPVSWQYSHILLSPPHYKKPSIRSTLLSIARNIFILPFLFFTKEKEIYSVIFSLIVIKNELQIIISFSVFLQLLYWYISLS